MSYTNDARREEARRDVILLRSQGLIDAGGHDALQARIERIREAYEAYARRILR